MHIYMAAVYTNSYMEGMNRYVKLNDREREIVNSLPHILESWHYVGKQSYVDHMKRCQKEYGFPGVFLDSGAFSAYTLNIELSVREYRSEEHTSELQSLMRISYAVFCLKKKKINT